MDWKDPAFISYRSSSKKDDVLLILPGTAFVLKKVEFPYFDHSCSARDLSPCDEANFISYADQLNGRPCWWGLLLRRRLYPSTLRLSGLSMRTKRCPPYVEGRFFPADVRGRHALTFNQLYSSWLRHTHKDRCTEPTPRGRGGAPVAPTSSNSAKDTRKRLEGTSRPMRGIYTKLWSSYLYRKA